MFSKEFGARAGTTVSNNYQIQLKKSICCRKNLEAATVDALQKKACQHRCFNVNVAKFLRTPILKNICERLLLKISTSETNLSKGGIIHDFFYPSKPFSILNFAMTEWFCYVTCFAKIFLSMLCYFITHIK